VVALSASQPIWAQTIWRARGKLQVVVSFCANVFETVQNLGVRQDKLI